jgi:hypothetical protein
MSNPPKTLRARNERLTVPDASELPLLVSFTEAEKGERAGDGGSGLFPIDHDGGSGTGGADCTFYIPYSNGVGVGSSADVLRYTTDGTSGYGGLTVRADLAADYDAGVRRRCDAS